MADREQPVGDGMPAPRQTAFAPVALDTFRRAPERKQYRPGKNRRDNDNAEQQHEYGQRGSSAPAAPRHHDLAGLIGHPGRTRTCERNQHQEQNDPMHRLPMARAMAPVWRAPSWPRSRTGGT